MPPDTYSDLFWAYAVMWGCVVVALSAHMFRGWKLERRVKALEQSISAGTGRT